jgi:hypothetical protein
MKEKIVIVADIIQNNQVIRVVLGCVNPTWPVN